MLALRRINGSNFALASTSATSSSMVMTSSAMASTSPRGCKASRNREESASAAWCATRWSDWPIGGEAGYRAAMGSLKRALTLDPNDSLALSLTAQVNLCDCVRGWSKDYTEQHAIGADALENYLLRNPGSVPGPELRPTCSRCSDSTRSN